MTSQTLRGGLRLLSNCLRNLRVPALLLLLTPNDLLMVVVNIPVGTESIVMNFSGLDQSEICWLTRSLHRALGIHAVTFIRFKLGIQLVAELVFESTTSTSRSSATYNTVIKDTFSYEDTPGRQCGFTVVAHENRPSIAGECHVFIWQPTGRR
jgi:hypothetical protein